MTPEEKNDQGGAALTASHELDAFLGKAFEEKPIWTGLWESIRDVFFPVKLPPLQLTSTPIPVPDRMAVKPNPWAIGFSTTFNVGALLLIIWIGIHFVHKIVSSPMQAINIDVGEYNAPKVNEAGRRRWRRRRPKPHRSEQRQAAGKSEGPDYASAAADV